MLWSLGLAPAAPAQRAASRGARQPPHRVGRPGGREAERSHWPSPGSHFPKRHFWGVRGQNSYRALPGNSRNRGFIQHLLKKKTKNKTKTPKKQKATQFCHGGRQGPKHTCEIFHDELPFQPVAHPVRSRSVSPSSGRRYRASESRCVSFRTRWWGKSWI